MRVLFNLKKCIIIILILAFSLIAVVARATTNPINYEKTQYTGRINAEGVNLRVGPSEISSSLGLLYNRKKVTIYPNKSTTNWYYVTRNSNGSNGYVKKIYLLYYRQKKDKKFFQYILIFFIIMKK